MVQAKQTRSHSRHQEAVECEASAERDLPTPANDFRGIVVVNDNEPNFIRLA